MLPIVHDTASPPSPIQVFIYYARQQSLPKHTHINHIGQQTAYNLWLIEQGTGLCRCGSSTVNLRNGELGLTPPGWHMEAMADTTILRCCFDLLPRSRRYVLRARPSGSRGRWQIDVDSPAQPSWAELLGFDVPVMMPAHWARSYNHLHHHLNAIYWQDKWGLNEANALLQTWINRYLSSISPQPSLPPLISKFKHQQRLIQAVEIINEKHGVISVDAVARAIGMSRTHFTRLFHQQYGTPPGTIIKQQAICAAKRKLLQGKSVDVVSRRIGFKTTSAFIRCFKASTGQTPVQWARLTMNPSEQVDILPRE